VNRDALGHTISSNMQTLYLVRHGESTANVQRIFVSHRTEPRLTALGILQAECVGRSFVDVAPKTILSSPSKRTKETAAMIAHECSGTFKIAQELREVDVGTLEGKSEVDPDAWQTYTSVIRSWQAGQTITGFDGGESLEAVRSRLLNLFRKFENSQDDTIVLVGHGLLFACFVWLFEKDHRKPIDECVLDCGTFLKASFEFSNDKVKSFTIHDPVGKLSAPSS